MPRGVGPGPSGSPLATPAPVGSPPARGRGLGPPSPAPAKTEASWEDVIRSIAQQEGVDPDLALSVSGVESSFDPSRVSPKGARGLFQLMPETAKELGVDPDDPVQNIQGGLRYLKKQLADHDFDLQTALYAYNAGPGNVAKGIIPEETKAYATAVQSRYMRALQAGGAGQMRQQGGVTLGSGMQGPDPILAGLQGVASFGESVVKAHDPRTPQGRVNLAGTAGAVGATLASGGLGAAPWIVRASAPILGAALGSGGMQAGENAMGTSTEDPLTAALISGGSEAVGGAIAWPVRTGLNRLVAGRVARAAKGTVEAGVAAADVAADVSVEGARKSAAAKVQQAVTAGRDVMATARAEARRVVDAATGQGASAKEAAAQASARMVADARTRAATAIREARATAQTVRETATIAGRQGIDSASATGARRLADLDLAHAAELDELKASLDRLPSADTLQVGKDASEVVFGPAAKARELAGQRVAAAAETGPVLHVTPVKDRLSAMVRKGMPESTRGAVDTLAADPIGYVAQLPKKQQARVAAQMSTAPIDQSQEAVIRKALDLPAEHPLPGVLRRVQRLPDDVPFAAAHELKTDLDDAIRWGADFGTRKRLERMTVGVRGELRRQMSVHEPYNVANDAYHRISDLWRTKAGKGLQRAARTDPDAIAAMLKPTRPAGALYVQDLLLTQAADGGDAAAGQQAWNGVRGAFTDRSLIRQGIDGLSGRIAALEKDAAPFMKIVYGDPDGQLVLGHLRQIGDAYTQAVARQAEEQAAAKMAARTGQRSASRSAVDTTRAAATSGQEAVSATREAARQGLEATTAAARGTEDAAAARARLMARDAKRTGQDLVTGARATAADLTSTAKATTQEEIRAAAKAGNDLRGAARADRTAFRQSSLARFANTGPHGVSVYKGVHPGWALLKRLLDGPRGADLVTWASRAPGRTQWLVRAIQSPVWDRGNAAVIRGALSEMDGALLDPNASPTTVPPETR